MKKALLVATFLLLLSPVLGFAQQRRGWIPDELIVSTMVVQATDSVRIVATWQSSNNFSETFEWRIPELAIVGTTANLSDSTVVEQPLSDLDAQFCIKTVRNTDLKESVEVCEPFVLPGVPVMPPDSVRIEVLVALVNSVTARWDTIAGTSQYWVTAETDAGLAARFSWNIYHRDAHCVGAPDHRPTGEYNSEGQEIIDVFT